MCISESVSVLALLTGVISILYSSYSISNKEYTPLMMFWTFVLLMQIVDWLVWRYKCGKIGLVASRLALVFNLMQPIMLYLFFAVLYKNKDTNYSEILISTVIISFWIAHCLYVTGNDYGCISTTECSNLVYSWWKDVSSIFYIFCITSLCLLLIKPLNFSILCVLFIILALIASMYYYSCGTASMWCFFVVIGPLFFGEFWKLTNKTNLNK